MWLLAPLHLIRSEIAWRPKVVTSRLANTGEEEEPAAEPVEKPSNDEAQRQLQLAKEAVDRGDLDAAEELYNGVLKKDAENQDAKAGLAALPALKEAKAKAEAEAKAKAEADRKKAEAQAKAKAEKERLAEEKAQKKAEADAKKRQMLRKRKRLPRRRRKKRKRRRRKRRKKQHPNR